MQPPSELIPRLSLLAIRSVRHVLWSNNIADFACLPWGAGLCVTSRVEPYTRIWLPGSMLT